MTALGPFYSNQDKAAPDLADMNTPCRDENVDAEIWFAESDSVALTDEQVEARRLCGLCPAREMCLKAALDNDETWGIWGGLTPRERRDLKPKVKRQQSQRQPINHGTEGGYQQHQRRHEKACGPCTKASTLAKRLREEKKERADVA